MNLYVSAHEQAMLGNARFHDFCSANRCSFCLWQTVSEVHNINISLLIPYQFFCLPFDQNTYQISIILLRAYQYQYFINLAKGSLINFNINLFYQCPPMILIRFPISYQFSSHCYQYQY